MFEMKSYMKQIDLGNNMRILTLRSIQTQHSVDWKVSIGGAEGADEDVESNGAGGGADGTFSCGGALGCAPATPFVWPYLAANCS